MKIVKLEAQNVKRLTAIEISPEGNLVLIGGRNDQGKTSVLDSIMFALGGKEAICAQPLRRGADSGKVVLNLGDLVIKRSFYPDGGGTLTVLNADGLEYRSPQTMLDKLVGRLSFDPLEFSKMRPADQRATLQSVVGVDVRPFDADRQRLYDERTAVGRSLRTLEGHAARMPRHDDAPTEDVDVAGLLKALESAEEEHRIADELHRAGLGHVDNAERLLRQRDRLVAQIKEFQETLKSVESSIVTENENAKRLVADEEKMRATAPPLAPIKEAIASAETKNRKRYENGLHARAMADIALSKKEVTTLTEKIEAIDIAKAKMLSEAKFPVVGLSFDESGVLLNGLPFDQASGAQQLRVSVAMGCALNPELRVLLVRDGSLLDPESLQLLAEMAEEQDCQVWLEVVRDDADCQVVIEDGRVREDAA